jgi:hypothetical protein
MSAGIVISAGPQADAAVVSWWLTVLQLVVGGVAAAGVFAGLGVMWKRRHVPTALVRRVARGTYMNAVLTESTRGVFQALDVLAPRLTPSAHNPTIAEIQDAWKKINDRGRVRVLTLDSRDCLEAGLELQGLGIPVRVSRRGLDSEGLSYHIFGLPGTTGTAIINHHHGRFDRPMRLVGKDPIKVFRNSFDELWQTANSLEAVIAEKIIERAPGTRQPAEIMRALASSGLDVAACSEIVRTHLAFRCSSSVVFVVGLPGSGKSRVRRMVAERLEQIGIETRQLTDYLYAYRDFLHSQIKLEPSRALGYEAYPGGAFAVLDETVLRPALQALDGAIRDNLKEPGVIVAEFARSDLVTALDQFDDIRMRCKVIYVHAPAPLRSARLSNRIEPPELSVEGHSLVVTPSDNHRLPSTVEHCLYAADDVARLEASPHWRDRILRIENDVDDGGAKINAKLDDFLAAVIAPYVL